MLTDIQAIPESAIPDKLFDEARAVVVVPDSLKAGFVIGGRRGHGLLSVKNPDGSWSNPAFVTLTGGSIGFQAGVQSADVILVFRKRRGVDCDREQEQADAGPLHPVERPHRRALSFKGVGIETMFAVAAHQSLTRTVRSR